MEILTPLQEQFLRDFFATRFGEKFYLGAGTALAAFYLRHRLSDDLDLFTLDENIDFDALNLEVAALINKLGLGIDHHVSTPTFLQFVCLDKEKSPLKVDFIKEELQHFGDIKDFDGIRIDSLENIAVSKLLSIYGRFDGKDFVDLFFIFKDKKLDFDNLLEKVQQKYPGLNPLYLAGNMADAPLLPALPETLKPFDRREFDEFFKNLSKNLFEKLRP